jgi:predicted metallo-beta-lactamase superfamily hydrolase
LRPEANGSAQARVDIEEIYKNNSLFSSTPHMRINKKQKTKNAQVTLRTKGNSQKFN